MFRTTYQRKVCTGWLAQPLVRNLSAGIPVCHSTVHSLPVPVLCTLQPHGLKILAAGLSTSVLDRHRFDADSDPDPNVHCDADPYLDPVKTMPIRLRIPPQVLLMFECMKKKFSFPVLVCIGLSFSSTTQTDTDPDRL